MPSVQLYVSLLGSKPLIWRRFLIPANTTAFDLHQVLQVVMGWHSTHLFEFKVGLGVIGVVDEYFDTLDIGKGKTEIEQITVEEMVDQQLKGGFVYSYDFGDGWDHRVIVEKFLEEDIDAPVCVEGEMACPPEDCGGIPGFYDFLTIWKNKLHVQHKETKKWVEKRYPNYDPKHFDIAVPNEELKDLLKPKKLKKVKAKAKK